MRNFLFILFLALLPAKLFAETPMITAHRGASFDAPENTLAAFQLAWQQGADAIEGDFYFTADHRIVCIHDKDTLRTAGVKKMVEQTSFDELRRLEYGKWKNDKYQGEPIPSFEEVLKTVPPGKRLVIELKSDSRIVPLLVQELERLKPDHASLLIIAFDAPTIRLCKKQLPDVQAHWLTSFKVHDDGNVSPTPREIASTVQSTGADGVGMKADSSIVNASFIRALKDAGCNEFHLWTVDDPVVAKQFAELGAIGITTNRPGLIREHL